MKEGYGIQTWPDGSVYEGDWLKNEANGKGKFIYANGDVYEGSWKMGRQVGMAYLFITLEVVMKDTGKMIWSTGSGHNAGQMATSMKDFTQEAKERQRSLSLE